MYKTFIQFLKVIVLIFIFNFTSERVFSQCYNCTYQNPAATISITANSGFQTISNCMKGGDYAICNVEIGNLYTWTTCLNSGNFNSQLTLFQGQTCSALNYIAYDDNFCNSGSQITWEATFTGLVTILLNKKNCKITTSSNCVNLSWESRMINNINPIQLCSNSSIYPAKTGQTGIMYPSLSPNWGCLLTNEIGNQSWYYFKIKSSGWLNMDIPSTQMMDPYVDAVIWGPFDNLSQAGQSTLNAPIACDRIHPINLSFYIPTTSVNKYYLLMMTNNNNIAATNTYSFLASSTAEIELCSPIIYYDNVCEGGTLQLHASSSEATAVYHWTGPGNFTSTLKNPFRSNVTNPLHSGIYSCYITSSIGISSAVNLTVVFSNKPITSLIYHN